MNDGRILSVGRREREKKEIRDINKT